jgi:hypothetical protein
MKQNALPLCIIFPHQLVEEDQANAMPLALSFFIN